MINFEKYKKELKNMEDGNFRVTKNGEVKECDYNDCYEECIFTSAHCCENAAWKWLFEEAKTLTEKEKELINTINSIRPKDYKFRYITRDINNDVFLFAFKPYLKVEYKTYDSIGDCMRVDSNLFENVTSETGVFDIKLNKFIEV